MRVDVSAEAERDLSAIGVFISKDNPSAAAVVVAELFALCLSLESAPERGRIIGVSRGVAIRRLVHRGYLLLYGVVSGGVRIYRIRHGAQHPAFLDDLELL